MKSAASASKEVVQRLPEQARHLVDAVKDKASVVGERANDALEGVTKALATAAGTVVGTVEAVAGSSQPGGSGPTSPSGDAAGSSDRDEGGNTSGGGR